MNKYHKNRNFGRWIASHNPQSPERFVTDRLNSMGVYPSACESSDFFDWLLKDAWSKYQKERMDKKILIENEVNSLPIRISNATKGKRYISEDIHMPADTTYDYQIEGIEDLGLYLIMAKDEKGVFNIQGVPTEAGDFNIVIKYKYDGWTEGEPLLQRKLAFAVNPNPRDLWKNIPSSSDVIYPKPDQVCEYVKVECGEDGSPRKDIVAASNRGRSHAQEGKPRDDHFQLFHSDDNDWYIIAVADGAGSAKYSRKGSEVACRTVVEHCKTKLKDPTAFEGIIKSYNLQRTGDEAAARKAVGDMVYHIVGNAAFMAHKAIVDIAKSTEGAKPKDYATTLLLAVCKKFDFGWFVASFWVGDGAMCIYNRDQHTIRLLGTPDEGEFSGQTRFLTMPEIFQDQKAFYQRLRFGIVDDFTALMLMTDGVSDPMFGTDANLNSVDKWDQLWDKLSTGFSEDAIPGVELSDDNEDAKYQLLRWLDFWMPGEHDDRTIAILY